MNSVKANLTEIEQKIAQAAARIGRTRDEITIVTVTKYASVERTNEAIECGLVNLGESYERGFLDKVDKIDANATWHFIGSLQSKKVKNVIDKIDYLHALDRMSLADEIQKRALKPIKCFVQVNVSGEESKHGLPVEEVKNFIQQLQDYDRIIVDGLMTMAPLTEDEDVIRSCFHRLKILQKELIALALPSVPCTHLSMGMSNDLEIAIEEGATMIRIGTALVGE